MLYRVNVELFVHAYSIDKEITCYLHILELSKKTTSIRLILMLTYTSSVNESSNVSNYCYLYVFSSFFKCPSITTFSFAL